MTLPVPARSTLASVDRVSASTSAVTLAAANVFRMGLFLYNDSTSEAFVKYGAGATSTDYTIKMGAGSYWEMPSPICTVEISCAWSTATGAMQVTEET